MKQIQCTVNREAARKFELYMKIYHMNRHEALDDILKKLPVDETMVKETDETEA